MASLRELFANQHGLNAIGSRHFVASCIRWGGYYVSPRARSTCKNLRLRLTKDKNRQRNISLPHARNRVPHISILRCGHRAHRGPRRAHLLVGVVSRVVLSHNVVEILSSIASAIHRVPHISILRCGPRANRGPRRAHLLVGVEQRDRLPSTTKKSSSRPK